MILREPYPDPPADDLSGEGKRKPDFSQGFRFPTSEKRGFETNRAKSKPKQSDLTRLPAFLPEPGFGSATRLPAIFSPTQDWAARVRTGPSHRTGLGLTDSATNRVVHPPSALSNKTGRIFGNFAEEEEHDLGHVLSNDSAIITERRPDTVRSADVAFDSDAKLPREARCLRVT